MASRKPAIEIFGRDTEAKRKANNVLDKMGMPSDYRTQYMAEMDMKGRAGKYKKAVKKSAGAKMNRYSK